MFSSDVFLQTFFFRCSLQTLGALCLKEVVLELGVTEQLGGLRTPTKRKSTDPSKIQTKGHDVT